MANGEINTTLNNYLSKVHTGIDLSKYVEIVTMDSKLLNYYKTVSLNNVVFDASFENITDTENVILESELLRQLLIMYQMTILESHLVIYMQHFLI